MAKQVDIEALSRVIANSGKDDPDNDWLCKGCGRLHTRCKCADIVFDAAPAMLAELQELRAYAATTEADLVMLCDSTRHMRNGKMFQAQLRMHRVWRDR